MQGINCQLASMHTAVFEITIRIYRGISYVRHEIAIREKNTSLGLRQWIATSMGVADDVNEVILVSLSLLPHAALFLQSSVGMLLDNRLINFSSFVQFFLDNHNVDHGQTTWCLPGAVDIIMSEDIIVIEVRLIIYVRSVDVGVIKSNLKL